jgi:hypothetical protein
MKKNVPKMQERLFCSGIFQTSIQIFQSIIRNY